ncbi:MAG: SAM-dependent DNA methyltransferase, partial [Planctomycetota bacterium]|nr:SAM-dependent DNA methyltransferase [Planctomycetota bacterium]
MPQPLSKEQRGLLERVVKEAREVAEAAGRAALERIAVGRQAAHPEMTPEQKDLRKQLRAHGRQLGDPLGGGSGQGLDRLAEEVAYEHWHRMLFARFLAENDLLMLLDGGRPVAISLAECEELARDEKLANGWEMAARCAARMLPQIFRPDSPVFRLALAPERQRRLEDLLAGLPRELFLSPDALGWIYQFWQSKQKEDINASEVKIGERELSAVTQLFTEPYMVSFLLDNTLGAWWYARYIGVLHDLGKADADDEFQARLRAAVPGVPLKHLRLLRDADGAWVPAASAFEHWPDKLSELRLLDPCCGSGHFLTAAFRMLVPLRMKAENLDPGKAIDLVISQNLYGLELDRRCVELAAFALALEAWRYPGGNPPFRFDTPGAGFDRGKFSLPLGYRKLPELHLACSGLAMGADRKDWKELAGNDKNLAIALDWLHDAFARAPILGSLIDPLKIDSPQGLDRKKVFTLLRQALKQEEKDAVRLEAAVAAQGLAKAAEILS